MREPVPPYRSLLPEGLGIFPQEEDQLRADPGYPQETGPCGFQLLWCQVLLHYVAFLCLRRGRAGTPKQGCRHLSSQALGPQEPLDPHGKTFHPSLLRASQRSRDAYGDRNQPQPGSPTCSPLSLKVQYVPAKACHPVTPQDLALLLM